MEHNNNYPAKLKSSLLNIGDIEKTVNKGWNLKFVEDVALLLSREYWGFDMSTPDIHWGISYPNIFISENLNEEDRQLAILSAFFVINDKKLSCSNLGHRAIVEGRAGHIYKNDSEVMERLVELYPSLIN